MRNAIIVHGKPTKEIYYSTNYPSSSNFAWIPWLQKQLIVKDIKTDTPEMPHAYEPDYKIWSSELERFNIGTETTLIGHSAGGGFLVRWLNENTNIKIDKLILVAPALDPDKKSSTGFCDFSFDPSLVSRTNKSIIFTSDNDSPGIQKSVEILQKEVPGIETIIMHGYGHFIPQHMNNSIEFQELLETIVQK